MLSTPSPPPSLVGPDDALTPGEVQCYMCRLLYSLDFMYQGDGWFPVPMCYDCRCALPHDLVPVSEMDFKRLADPPQPSVYRCANLDCSKLFPSSSYRPYWLPAPLHCPSCVERLMADRVPVFNQAWVPTMMLRRCGACDLVFAFDIREWGRCYRHPLWFCSGCVSHFPPSSFLLKDCSLIGPVVLWHAARGEDVLGSPDFKAWATSILYRTTVVVSAWFNDDTRLERVAEV